MPRGLTVIQGRSLNANKLVQHLIQTTSEVKPPKISACSEAPKKLQRLSMIDDLSVSNALHVFKSRSLENLDPNKNIVEIVVPDWPVNLMADGCSTNICASREISEQLGILSSSIRCTSHAAIGTIKRISISQARNVPQITEFLPIFCTVMHHFQLCRKSLALLNEALQVLDMKEIHLMTFCSTCMAYLLTVCSQVVHLLLPICDVMTSANLKTEERSSFTLLQGMFRLTWRNCSLKNS